MLIKILIGLAVLLAIILVVAAVQPKDYRVARSTSVVAPASIPFTYANDLHRWLEVSPYAKFDAACKYTFEGPSSGVGASMTWAGNSRVGEGRMTIIESRPHELVRMRLEFIKPFASTGIAEFTFQPQNGQTAVTWSMSGEKIFVTKVMGLIMSMDKMLGGQFEEGLAAIKTRSEAEAKKS